MTDQEQDTALANFAGDAKQRAVLCWLVGTPATDENFKSALNDADDVTIKETLRIIEGDTGMATKRKALESRLKKILAGLIAVNDRQSRTLTMEVETLEEERTVERQRTAEQVEREKMIAKCHEVIGQVKTAKMFANFGNVSSLLWLKDVKEQKIYRDVPGVGTWEKFCENAGLCRRKVDEDLLNLQAFGEEFLGNVSILRVGYREMKQLRQLSASGEFSIDAEAMIIGDERIPLNAEHSEELQAAIEKIIEEKNAIRQRIDKLDKDLAGVVKEETKGLKAELSAALREVKRLKPFDPEEKDRTWSVEQMAEICGHSDALSTAIYKFILDPRLKGDHQLIAEINGYIQASENELRELRDRFEAEFDVFGG